MVQLMNPSAGMRTREVIGGTGPKSVAAALAEAEQRLSS
jgi:hypothetical protein